MTQERLAKAGINLERKPVKGLNLGLIYGMGLGKLAEKVDRSIDETRQIKATIMEMYPGLKALYADMKALAAANLPLRTWGSRLYYCEEPKLIDGQLRRFDYKMVNLLIQGSAADCTKEAMIRYGETKPRHHRMLLTVHDELVASAPRGEMHEAMECLRVAMESVEFDVPMLSEGSWSAESWQALEDYDAGGMRVCAATT
jgi:DNA polymerase I-like protein with 3'-5' exonuclease and polymerase domains